MTVRRPGGAMALALLVAALVGGLVRPAPAHAQDEYTMETVAAYAVDPSQRRIEVSVEVSFTNTTPDPEGLFSIFDEVLLAVHDAAAEASAEDDAGPLELTVARNDAGVNVATVELREPVRFEETAEFTLRYALPDGGQDGLRVRTSAVIFPAWSFGTSGQVEVELPASYEVRADGDTLEAESDGAITRLTSGPIEDPTQWLAVITATRPSGFTTFSRSVPLSGGTADLRVRAWQDDPEWGERTLDLLAASLPLLEREIGLPYPHVGALVVTEAVASDPSGFGEARPGAPEILIAFDQPPFTAVHQLAHVWIGPELADARWISEGLASHYASAVAGPLQIARPFDPTARTAELAASAFTLDEWQSVETAPEREQYGYAASWVTTDAIAAAVGGEALTSVLRRVAADVGPYRPLTPEPPPASSASVDAMGSRDFLDQLEQVADVPLGDLFAAHVLGAGDASLLPARGEARAAFDELLAAAGDWGAPDPISAAMSAWQFDEARSAISEAIAWLEQRDALLADLSDADLAAPQRLRDHFVQYGGGPEAQEELAAERAVVDGYGASLARAAEERTPIESIGLLGATPPEGNLAAARASFAEGDLRAAAGSIALADRALGDAATAGLLRILGALALAVIVGLGLRLLWRRRRSVPPTAEATPNVEPG